MPPSFYQNSVFWIEVDKIKPNPFQPRREFDEAKLQDLAGSIRQYGLLQPVTVTRKEVQKEDGGLAAEYELVAGERRLRASRLAGLLQIPALIRAGADDDGLKLELAIIENLQREDLNPIDRAKAFERLLKEFNFKHIDIAKRVGKSREYVSNTVRLLMLPADMQTALAEGRIAEGHTRPLLMLIDRPAEQQVLFRDILERRLSVRDTESIARRIAFDKVRKKEYLYAPEIMEMERELTEKLGTRVSVETKENGGKIAIDFYSEDDLHTLFATLGSVIAKKKAVAPAGAAASAESSQSAEASAAPEDDRSAEEVAAADENEFNPDSFSI